MLVVADEHAKTFGSTHDALSRMRRAYERGTGCRLTAEMIQNLSLSVIGSMWGESDPRDDEAPCSECGNEERGQGGYLTCQCPAT